MIVDSWLDYAVAIVVLLGVWTAGAKFMEGRNK